MKVHASSGIPICRCCSHGDGDWEIILPLQTRLVHVRDGVVVAPIALDNAVHACHGFRWLDTLIRCFLLGEKTVVWGMPRQRAISRTVDRRLKGKARTALTNSTGSYLRCPKFRILPDVTFHSPSGSFRCSVNIGPHIFDTHECVTENLAAVSLMVPDIKRLTCHRVSRKSLMSWRTLAVRSLVLPILPLKYEFVVKNLA